MRANTGLSHQSDSITEIKGSFGGASLTTTALNNLAEALLYKKLVLLFGPIIFRLSLVH